MGRLLVGFDGSPPARRAVEHAAQQARAGGHEIILLTVLPRAVAQSGLSSMMPAGLQLPPPLAATFEESARRRLDELAAQLKASGVSVRAEVRAGDAVEQLVGAADEFGASEIVLGHKSFEDEATKTGPNAMAIVERARVRVTLVP